jgi:hypothetical protein
VPDVDERLVVVPGELLRDRQVGAVTESGHCGEELLQAGRIRIQRLEEWRLARLRLVLELPRAQCLGEAAPEAIQAVVGHLQDAAHVRRLVLVEEQVRARCVVVNPVATLEEPEGHQRVEKVPRRPRVQTQPVP